MYLDQHGGVRACCQNAHYPMGYVTEKSLAEIWRGGRAGRLRRALEQHDYSHGCEFCEWQVADGHESMAYARWYDYLPLSGPEPEWPLQLELSMSNTCNLQCVMCNGDWSSSIRAQREHRPPLPAVYDDAFFDDLRRFLPHLERVKFLGGEPFLAAETLRVMDLLIETGSSARCHVTTNGTQWSPRVERILDLLPVDLTVSIDGATRETYESIRQGARWDQILEHLDRFQERSQSQGTEMSLVFCLMKQNWHEFAAFCRLADERDLACAVNTVTHPDHMSLFRLPPGELNQVVIGLEQQWETVDLGSSATVFTVELDRLRRHLVALTAGRPVDVLVKRDLDPSELRNGANVSPDVVEALQSITVTDRTRLEERVRAILRDELQGRVSWLDVGPDQVIVDVGGDELPGAFIADRLPGRLVSELVDVLGGALGAVDRLETGESETVRFERAGREMVRLEWNLQRFRALMGDGSVVCTLNAPRLDDEGSPVGTRLYLAFRPART